MERYGLREGSMPKQLLEIWDANDASGKNLETVTDELAIYAAKMLAIADRSSARYQAYANYLRRHIHEHIWPFFHARTGRDRQEHHL